MTQPYPNHPQNKYNTTHMNHTPANQNCRLQPKPQQRRKTLPTSQASEHILRRHANNTRIMLGSKSGETEYDDAGQCAYAEKKVITPQNNIRCQHKHIKQTTSKSLNQVAHPPQCQQRAEEDNTAKSTPAATSWHTVR